MSSAENTETNCDPEAEKIISFAIPCFNASEYMDHCIGTLLEAYRDRLDHVEIIIVDDGSTKDDTAEKADRWHRDHPETIRAIHQKNGGHGAAVNTGISNATGVWFKVVDSDDWLDIDAAQKMLDLLEDLYANEERLDLLIVNYVYEKVYEGKQVPIRYKGVLPEGRIFSWEEVGTFKPQQNLLMHSVVYRTQLLRDVGLELPRHTFYVDNVFVYVPLPQVETLYYLNVDLYRYYIGREGQSVNEATMISRVDQQLRVTRVMIDSVDLESVIQPRLKAYMTNFLTMMMVICSIFLLLSKREDRLEQRKAIWAYLKERNPKSYSRIRNSFMGRGSILPGSIGRACTLAVYRVAQRIFKFN
ncbi:MAG: glycosyltransferase [Coriobacteriaceae bacterium]|nr:glycosyltransferase [Coriobacteriaceae bacterium]